MSSGPERTIRSRPNTQRILRALALVFATAGLFGAVTDSPQRGPVFMGANPRAPSPALVSIAPLFASSAERPRRVHRSTPKPERLPSLTGRIIIPAIGVDAPLTPLGLTSGGALDVPGDWASAGWFTGGPFPGEPGPAVVVGHVDSTRGPAVFYRLRELHRGDLIVLWRKGGIRSRFRVSSFEWVSKSAFPTQRVYGPVVAPVLRLITCGGAFDRSVGHYVDNLIVFAVASA
jgi:sortase (surface protein transpeptidase)